MPISNIADNCAERTYWVVGGLKSASQPERDFSRLFVCSTPPHRLPPHMWPSPPCCSCVMSCYNILMMFLTQSLLDLSYFWPEIPFSSSTLLACVPTVVYSLPSWVGNAAFAESADRPISASCSPRFSSQQKYFCKFCCFGIFEKDEENLSKSRRVLRIKHT